MKITKNYFFIDMITMLGRSMKHILRSLDTIITVTLTPIAMMLLFVYVLGGVMKNGMTTGEYVAYMLPGIFVMAIASGIAYTAIRLYADVKSGIFDRFHTMPISSSAVLWAHVLTSLVANFISLLLIVLVALLMGFRSSASIVDWFIMIGILIMFTLALTWIAIIAGLKATSPEGASAFSYPLVFLPFISSAFVPTETMPFAVRIFAENQPVTAIVNSIRCLLTNQPITNDLWISLTWCMGILIIAYFFAIKAYKNR